MFKKSFCWFAMFVIIGALATTGCQMFGKSKQASGVSPASEDSSGGGCSSCG